MRNLIAGLILLVFAAVAAWQGSALTVGTPRHIGRAWCRSCYPP